MGSKIRLPTNWKVASTTEEYFPNRVLKRTVWSSPQNNRCCNLCVSFGAHDAKVSELNRNVVMGTSQEREKLTFGRCQNVRIWAAMGKDQPPITRSYYCCNYFKEKD